MPGIPHALLDHLMQCLQGWRAAGAVQGCCTSAVFTGMRRPASLLRCHVAGRLGALPVLCEAMLDSAVFIACIAQTTCLSLRVRAPHTLCAT